MYLLQFSNNMTDYYARPVFIRNRNNKIVYYARPVLYIRNRYSLLCAPCTYTYATVYYARPVYIRNMQVVRIYIRLDASKQSLKIFSIHFPNFSYFTSIDSFQMYINHSYFHIFAQGFKSPCKSKYIYFLINQ